MKTKTEPVHSLDDHHQQTAGRIVQKIAVHQGRKTVTLIRRQVVVNGKRCRNLFYLEAKEKESTHILHIKDLAKSVHRTLQTASAIADWCRKHKYLIVHTIRNFPQARAIILRDAR